MRDALGTILREYPIVFALLGVASMAFAIRDTLGLYARHERLTVPLIVAWARKDGVFIALGVFIVWAAIASQPGAPGF